MVLPRLRSNQTFLKQIKISTPEATPPDDHFKPDSHIVASKQKRGKRSPTAPTQPKSPKHDLPTKKSEIAVGMVIF